MGRGERKRSTELEEEDIGIGNEGIFKVYNCRLNM